MLHGHPYCCSEPLERGCYSSGGVLDMQRAAATLTAALLVPATQLRTPLQSLRETTQCARAVGRIVGPFLSGRTGDLKD